MSGSFADLKVNGTCFVSNYMPNDKLNYKDGKAFNIWYKGGKMETGGQISDRRSSNVSEVYTKLLNKICSLGGDKNALDIDDLKVLAEDRGWNGKHIDKSIDYMETDVNNAGVVKITLKTGEVLRIDFKLDNEKNDKWNKDSFKNEVKNSEKERALNKKMEHIGALYDEIEAGNATYNSGVEHYILQLFSSDVEKRGAEIKLTLPKQLQNKTLGEVKSYYNLPEGCLRNNGVKGSGDVDNRKIGTTVYIHVESLAQGLGVSKDEIKAMFN